MAVALLRKPILGRTAGPGQRPAARPVFPPRRAAAGCL